MDSALSHLECSECRRRHDADRRQTVCRACGSPLLARYDLERASRTLDPETVQRRRRGIWRWAELLPVRKEELRFTLGEGDTPLVPVPRLGSTVGLRQVYIKDESGNPTGSFKARGLAVAVSKAVELGSRNLVIPTAGNAGGALAAYARRADISAHVYMPKDAPLANQTETRAFGAETVLVGGLINEAGRLAAAAAAEHGWFDVSTFKEPYRLEGKKTMGLELIGAIDGRLPDVIVYPTGGGTGLIGMWKAFDEMESLGWIDGARPRLVSVQASGCAPIVRAFQAGLDHTEPWADAYTAAAGLRVPSPFADRLILRAIQKSHGIAIAVSEEEIATAQAEVSKTEGVLASPEGGATWAGLRKLAAEGWVEQDEHVVLFNTGSGLKYL